MAAASATRELALLRLVAQGLAGPRLASPGAVAERLLCLQAQDYWSGLASVAVRCGIGLDQVQAAFDAGEVVRAWPLRGTLHLLGARDLRWMRELLAPRQLAGAALRESREGLDGPLLERAQLVAEQALTSSGPMSRAELNRAWADAGLDIGGQGSYHLIWHLAHSGTLVLGPTRGGQHLFTLARDWLPPTQSIERAEALKLLAVRYFSGHGPATAADLTRWANLTVADTRLAIAAAGAELETFSIGETAYLLGPETRDTLAGCRKQAEAVLALPHFDELLLGYRDRNPTLPPERDLSVFANRNAVPAPTIVYRGQVVATWKRPQKALKHGRPKPPEITPLVSLTARVRTQAEARAAEISGRSSPN